MQKKKQQSSTQGTSNTTLYILYMLLVILIVAYVISGSTLLAAFAFVVIAVIIATEVRYSIKSEGMSKSIKDIGAALGAVAVFWLILILIFNTTSPVNVVASCSMLPVLHRGDIVLLHGVGNTTQFLERNHVPIINMSSSEYSNFLQNINNEFVAFYAYDPNNRSKISTLVSGGGYDVGLYNEKCVSTYSYLGEPNNFYQCFVPQSVEASNPIKYNYSVGKIQFSGANVTYNIIYTSTITIGNTTLSENYSNPIVVYATTPNDTFSGDIVHRLWVAIKVGNTYHFLTKGDNNPYLDLQAGNYPSDPQHLVGYVAATVPYLGYLNLIIFHPSVPAGCNETILR